MIDMTKKYRTRDGRDVRLLCTDGPDSSFPIVGFVLGNKHASKWDSSGAFVGVLARNHETDLIEVVPDVVYWTNVYRGKHGDVSHKTPDQAALGSIENRIALTRTTIRNGGKSHADVSVDVLPVDYKETP